MHNDHLFIPFNSVHTLITFIKAAIYKMLGSHHFQALKNNQSVGWYNFFHFFYIFNFCIPGPGENKTKRKGVSGRLCDMFRDLEP